MNFLLKIFGIGVAILLGGFFYLLTEHFPEALPVPSGYSALFTLAIFGGIAAGESFFNPITGPGNWFGVLSLIAFVSGLGIALIAGWFDAGIDFMNWDTFTTVFAYIFGFIEILAVGVPLGYWLSNSEATSACR